MRVVGNSSLSLYINLLPELLMFEKINKYITDWPNKLNEEPTSLTGLHLKVLVSSVRIVFIFVWSRSRL